MLTNLLALLVSFASAHTTGHGPYIHGVGPTGARLVAVVSAKEADLGKNAKTMAVAEWRQQEKSVEVTLWDNSQKNNMNTNGPSEVKWIILGQKLKKPVVIKTSIQGAIFKLSQNIDAKVLKKADSIELILPNLGESKEKHVLSFELLKSL